jgi:hypothetical protein
MSKLGPWTALATAAAFFLGAAPAMAAPASKDTSAKAATDQSAASRTRRARTQVRVTPRYPYRHYHSFYPVPYSAEYPGPNGVRRCTDRYVTEHRPSGTVIVPRTSCVWVVRR